MRLWARLCWPRASVRALLVLAVAPMALAAPVEGPLETVVFQAGDTIRGVAERYLKDPDLWPQILELSGIASPADLRPGAELLVPVQQVAAADEALAVSLAAIQKATAEGARHLRARSRSAARSRTATPRSSGATSAPGPRSSPTRASPPSSPGRRSRSRSPSATGRPRRWSRDAQGSVEGRAPDQPRWSPRAAKDVLVEFERVRTLSASTAQVTFRDLSRLRLNPNSNAIIQRMRSDPLTGGEVTKVSLVNGDFYALLNQLGDRTAFEVEVPGVETADPVGGLLGQARRRASRASPTTTRRRSRSPAAARRSASARTRARSCRRPARRERDRGAGARRARRAVRRRADLRPRGDARPGARPTGAEAYWLEVAADADFNTMQASEWGVRGTSPTGRGPGAGRALLAGLLARPARAAGRAQPEPALPRSSTTGRRRSSRSSAPQEGEIVTAAEVDGRRRERARRPADGQRRLRPGRRQRRLPDVG